MIKYFALMLSAVLVGIDQLIKLQVLSVLAPVGRIEVVRGFFYLTYVENRGAAFGILQGHTNILTVVTSMVLVGALYLLLSGRIASAFLTWSLSLVIAGGAGNLIDRIFRSFVVDYLDFSVIFGFPVFNFADCCVVVGTALILCGILWHDRQAGQGIQGKEKEA